MDPVPPPRLRMRIPNPLVVVGTMTTLRPPARTCPTESPRLGRRPGYANLRRVRHRKHQFVSISDESDVRNASAICACRSDGPLAALWAFRALRALWPLWPKVIHSQTP